jgi:hypothetical protein
VPPTLPLREGPPPPPPRYPGVKPKVYFAVAVVVVALGVAVALLAVGGRAQQRSLGLRDGMITGGAMITLGLGLAVISQRAKNRQTRARAALAEWAGKNDFRVEEPDLATGKRRGVRLALRVGYGSARSRGDARGWLVEAGEPGRSGWVIVFDAFDDEAAIRARLDRIADAALHTVKTSRS